MDFLQKLKHSISKNNSLLSVGLDPDLDKIPKHLLAFKCPLFEFNKKIIEATFDLVCAYKPQIAHYSALGLQGLETLLKTLDYLKHDYPEIPIILDAKRADIESTSRLYAKEAFDVFGTDAVTVNPYFGLDSLLPFLQRKGKGIIIICRTSNPSTSDFQDLKVHGEPLYLLVAKKIAEWNKKYHNCLMVIGATWPEQLRKVREIAPDMFFLVPGVGTQGGNLERTLKNGLRKDKSGLIIHISRAIMYASKDENFAKNARYQAKKIRDLINKYRYE